MKIFVCWMALLVLWCCAGFAETMPAGEQVSSFGQYQPAPLYYEALTTSQYLTMRDGVRLAISITRPSQNGKPIEGRFPVLWQHTLSITAPGILASNISIAMPGGYNAVPNLAYYSYVVVQVARRGQGPSFGKRRGYNDRSEAYDAYEVIDWLASQPWSAGAVGIYGCSNTGDASMHAVTAANRHLKAAWAGCFSWEKYDGFWRGGIYANWGTGPERTIEQDIANTPVQGDEAKLCSHREDAQPLKPGEPVQLVFAFLPESYIFKAGHRIRIPMAGSDYRERDRASVSPAPVVTIYNTPSNPSYISLPIINRKGANGQKGV
jgi:uncharacterized protein